MKIRIAMIDSDMEYVNRFFKCINDNYSDRVELHIFSKLESFYNNISNIKYEVILLNEQYINDIDLKYGGSIVIYLVDNLIVNNNLNFIKKYQKVSNIYNEILNVYSEKYISEIKENKNNITTKIITFLSYDSNIDSSIHSLLYSRFLVKKIKKVLILDLQNIAIIGYYLNSEGKFNLSDILYSIKSKNSDILGKLNSSIKCDKTGIDYISPCKNLLERSEATKEDIDELISNIIKLKVYDYIVVNINYLIDDICKYLLEKSNKLCFIYQYSELENYKISQVIDSIKIIQSNTNKNYIKKINFIENKCDKKSIVNYKSLKDINIIGSCETYDEPVFENMINNLDDFIFYKKLT